MGDQGDRKLGTVTKSFYRKQWVARFQFRSTGERITMHGPLRESSVAAEKDRDHIAATMKSGRDRMSRQHAASAAVKKLTKVREKSESRKVASKVRWMLSYRVRHGSWPPRSHSKKVKAVSKALWTRVRRDYP
jgi:hypothetical protein